MSILFVRFAKKPQKITKNQETSPLNLLYFAKFLFF